MSVVVDSSVLVAALVDASPNGQWAERVIEEHPVFGPEILFAETTNILRRLELADHISGFEAASAYQDSMQLNLESYPFRPFAERIWELRSTLTGYDAWYVAVAEGLDLPLATLDSRLARAPGTRCRFLLPE